MKDSSFLSQVRLLLSVIPHVMKEEVFALKGGTAINLFIRNMPRLSVDIDLTYLPLLGRTQSLKDIGSALQRSKERIGHALNDAHIMPVKGGGAEFPSGLVVEFKAVRIKVEVNLILRGSVFPPTTYELCKKAQETFESHLVVKGLSRPDIYGGKLCAALDRQHPRDLFDVKLLLDDEGITDDIRKAFIVYLASHDRPMNELLSPIWKDISQTFDDDFQGMTTDPITLTELLIARDQMLQAIKAGLTANEKQFLISLKMGEPDWQLLGLKGIEDLPGVQWKLLNIKKMGRQKRDEGIAKLKMALEF